MFPILDQFKNYELVLDLLNNKDSQTHSTVEEAVSLATLYLENPRQIVVVKDNLYHAEKLYDQLSHLCKDVFIYMSEESKRIESIASSPEFRANRLALLSMLNKNEFGIIVTHTAALLRYLPSKEVFRDNVLNFKVNEQSDYKNIKRNLIKAGYQLSKRVDHPLTFSVRGEIIDIFSINYDQPIRIEFFDNEVESIRFFDLETQLTVDKIDEVDIIPATDILFSNEEKDLIKNKLQKVIETKKNMNCTIL